MIDTDFEEPKEPRSILDLVNDALKANSTGDTITVQDIAENVGISSEQLSVWVSSNEVFQAGLEKFRKLQDAGIFDELENRADATVIAMLLLEAKNNHK